jgi:hypothetical protein
VLHGVNYSMRFEVQGGEDVGTLIGVDFVDIVYTHKSTRAVLRPTTSTQIFQYLPETTKQNHERSPLSTWDGRKRRLLHCDHL